MERDQVNTYHLKSSSASELQNQQVSLGEVLRSAREKKHLSVDGASSALRIPVRYVLALESGDYACLPGSTYIRGYLRAYSRLLDISSDGVIEKYQEAQAKQSPVDESLGSPLKRVTVHPQLLHHKQNSLPRASIVILAMSAAMFFSYFYWQSGDSTAVGQLDIQKVSVESANGDLIVEDLSPVVASAKTSAVDAAQQIKYSPHADEDKQLALYENEDTPTEQPAERVSVSGEKIKEEQSISENGSFLSDSFSQIVDSITLQAQEPCWVKVTDSKGGTLHVALMGPGESKSLSGNGPFQLVLGNAKGIKVQFNGEEVDLGAYQHKQSRVAVLRLGS
ncbi:MAG TPA: RodZ domain-containing protein [Pseudomonadales bacterium]|nr:RodZ domain-containing protein [Pseudomonadales bacterium]